MSTVTFQFKPDGPRRCAGCTLCCRLIPVRELHKKAGERCQHQRTGKGCAIHNAADMPRSCAIWNCRWLVNNDTADLRRPDRSHCVIDVMPDFITLQDNETGAKTNVEVVQVWVDPNYRDAWRTPQMLAYIERRGSEGIATLIRYSAAEGFTVFPPTMAADKQWHEVHGQHRPDHTPQQLFAGIAKARNVKVT